MGYDFETWRKRHQHRADITGMITHLTREAVIDGSPLSAVAVLVKILNEKCIKGSTTASGFIVGDRPAVCFQGTPLFGLAENIRYEEAQLKTPGRIRYRGVGVAFNKLAAFSLGARPVIYEKTEVAKRMLPPTEHWRIVDLDLDNKKSVVDWTHEREWRAPGDFSFDLRWAAVIVNTSDDYRELLESADPVILKQLMGLTVLRHAIA
jgi:hypothetical protein